MSSSPIKPQKHKSTFNPFDKIRKSLSKKRNRNKSNISLISAVSHAENAAKNNNSSHSQNPAAHMQNHNTQTGMPNYLHSQKSKSQNNLTSYSYDQEHNVKNSGGFSSETESKYLSGQLQSAGNALNGSSSDPKLSHQKDKRKKKFEKLSSTDENQIILRAQTITTTGISEKSGNISSNSPTKPAKSTLKKSVKLRDKSITSTTLTAENRVNLPAVFITNENKLLAVESSYLTLKKVLQKHFSLQAKLEGNDKNVSNSIRRSFHEVIKSTSRSRRGSNESLDKSNFGSQNTLHSEKSEKSAFSYNKHEHGEPGQENINVEANQARKMRCKAALRLQKEAYKLKEDGLNSYIFEETAKTLKLLKEIEITTAELISNQLIRKVDTELNSFTDLKLNYINPLKNLISTINTKTH